MLTKHLRHAAALAGLAAAVALSSAPPAGALVPAISASPTSGPAGTTVHVSASGCGTADTVTVTVVPGYDGTSAPGGASAIATTTGAGSDTTWSYDVVVPLSAAPGSYTIAAHCTQVVQINDRVPGLRAQQAGFDYAPVEFTVTQQVTTTLPPTTVAPTTLAATTTTMATAPQAIAATPTYTG